MFSSEPAIKTKMTCALKVNTNSAGWHKSMMKILKKIKGTNFTIDVEEGTAYVTGQGDPNKLLKLLGTSAGKDAEVAWVKTGKHNDPNHTYDTNYYYYHGQGMPYNYWRGDVNYPNYPYPAPSYYPGTTYPAALPYHHGGHGYVPSGYYNYDYY